MPLEATETSLDAWLSENLNREKVVDYRDWRLDPLKKVLALLPKPRRTVTIAGTKGKGSTTRMLECILHSAGIPTLSHTSPHVCHVTERWRRNTQDLDLTSLCRYAVQVSQAESQAGQNLSYFERAFCLACIAAAEDPNSIFLSEVGLGGRLDCANALDADIAIVTHLSHDHCAILGDTVGKIATEKFAISRPGRPLLIGAQRPEFLQEIQSVVPAGPQTQWVSPLGADCPPIALIGEHQKANAALAWRAAQILVPGITRDALARGLAIATLPARCQIVSHRGRRILIDGAHNGPSIEATLAVAAQELRPGWQLVLGLAKDKEAERIAAVIGKRANVHRSGFAWMRARLEHDWPAACQTWPWHDSLETFLSEIDQDICITGSFYLAGEALRQINPR
jgi:dihydrofolate synthase/folylpolyglutamate synthase